MKNLRSGSRRIIATVFILCLFFMALIWGSYLRQRAFDRADAIEFAVQRNSNLAVALEEYAIRTVHNADAILQLVKMQYAAPGSSLDLEEMLQSHSLDRDLIEGVAITDAKGRVQVSNIPHLKTSRADLSGQPFFIFHSVHNADSLLISKPVAAAGGGPAMIVLSRRLEDAQGAFSGVILLQMQPSAFTSFYAKAHLLPNDIISLIADDGITYARRTGKVESSGEDISASPLFTHVREHADSFYRAPDAIRHVPTWFSYRKLENYPMIATVGSSEADILADLLKRQPRYIVPRIIISILILLFSVLITVFLVHRRRLSDRLSEEEEKYQRLLTEQMIAVQEREREWIGRELHDNVNQVLTTVKLYLETASREPVHPLVPRSMQLINSCVTEIRNLSHQLSAPTLGTRSLIDSINGLLETLTLSTNLKFVFDHHVEEEEVIMSQKLAIYRIVQEQLNNIVKHAEAHCVRIRLSMKQGMLVLRIKDDGKGFDRSVQRNGMGFSNIISRARVFGGVVRVESAPGAGCCVTVSLRVRVVEGELSGGEKQALIC